MEPVAVVSPVATFHLLRERRSRAVIALARLGLDRRRLRATDGLLFWRLLGTGQGANTGRSIDPRRTAIFAVWRDAEYADRFEADMAPRWARLAEAYHVRMIGLSGHGSWNGFDVVRTVQSPGVAPAGPIAVITRAEVRLRHLRAFTRAARQVSAELGDTPGLLAVCGVGEAPIGRQATFSLWRSAGDIDAFGARAGHHGDAVGRTRRYGWYGEELFARFQPIGWRGSWDGRDPLGDAALANDPLASDPLANDSGERDSP
jgi:hypothetical protein